jgi:hypothetical protein
VKVLHATVDVRESRMPGVVWWTLFVLGTTVVAGYAVFRVVQRRKTREP